MNKSIIRIAPLTHGYENLELRSDCRAEQPHARMLFGPTVSNILCDVASNKPMLQNDLKGQAKRKRAPNCATSTEDHLQ